MDAQKTLHNLESLIGKQQSKSSSWSKVKSLDNSMFADSKPAKGSKLYPLNHVAPR